MNFVTRAALTLEQREDPALAFGAMLPDLASLCGARLKGVSDPVVAEGVAWHLASDAAFHDSALFRSIVRSAARDGVARGVRRGIARAAAHVAIELWLDEGQLSERDFRAFFKRAIGVAQDARINRAISWRRPDGTPRWQTLLRKLASLELAREGAPRDAVAERVVRALGRRPGLVPLPCELEALHAVAASLEDRVRIHADALLEPASRALAKRASMSDEPLGNRAGRLSREIVL